jgi:hypothetical protein
MAFWTCLQLERYHSRPVTFTQRSKCGQRYSCRA